MSASATRRPKRLLAAYAASTIYLAVPLMIVPDICPPAAEDATFRKSNARESNPAAHVQLQVERTIANFL
jgi:hypothetical protein